MIASYPDGYELQLEDMSREQVDMRLLAFCVMPNHWHLAHGTVDPHK
jgi:REP element-mobilizing transposase RayT